MLREPPGDRAWDLVEADFAGLHRQHAEAWRGFNTMLRILVVLEALPWVVAGGLASNPNIQLDQLVRLRGTHTALTFSLLFTGLVGIFGLKILIHNRLNILVYARALNGFRALYVEAVPRVRELMPSDPQIPPTFELRGMMLILLVLLGGVNAFYFAIAALNLADSEAWGVLAGLAAVAWVIAWYHQAAAGPLIPGFEGGPGRPARREPGPSGQAKLNAFAFSTALAILTAGIHLAFLALALIGPPVFDWFFNAQFFGADVASLFPRTLSVGRVFAVLVTLVASVWVLGYTLALLYNRLNTS